MIAMIFPVGDAAQILRSIVISNPIDVIDLILWPDSRNHCHYQAMGKHSLAQYPSLPIPFGGVGCKSFLASVLGVPTRRFALCGVDVPILRKQFDASLAPE